MTREINYGDVKNVRKSYGHDFSSAAAFLCKHSAIVPAHHYIYLLLLHMGFSRVSNITEAKGRVFNKSLLPAILHL